MTRDFLDYFELDKKPFKVKNGYLSAGADRFPIVNGIPRFTPDVSYAGNFALQWERYSKLQLDSHNKTTDKYDTILARTQWHPQLFRGKTVLECGCGAGSDTEILLSLGCKVVAVDLVAGDTAKKIVNDNPNVQFVQASITNLPLRKKSFDIVFCHRVLQHTPDPEKTLAHILQFVKDDGSVFVHSYANTFFQRFRWKYFLLPITRRLRPEILYNIIRRYSKLLWHFTNLTNKTKIGRAFNWFFVPFLNYRYCAKFANISDEAMLEYAILTTFDALGPKYDNPIKPSTMRRIASASLKRPFEIVEGKMITLLRTRLD
ncbi:MAG: class I SAM-dependent methyltransferase [Planctomycetota bacterium]|jgi:2-polyprenyl-3-methyl-5-hydroxy-6-metoxy-1,4-benzoquinol methylase